MIIKEGNAAQDEIRDDRNPVYFFSQKAEIQKTFSFIEQGNHYMSLTIVCDDAKEMKKLLFAQYRIIRAAGGCVFSPDKKLLMIFRHGIWDLPKGKIEKMEGKKKAAVREVREETGIEKLELVSKLMKTYHTYISSGNQKVIKVTHWYLMHGFDDGVLKPQIQEGIESAVWTENEMLQEKFKNMYGSIRDVVDAGLVAVHKM